MRRMKQDDRRLLLFYDGYVHLRTFVFSMLHHNTDDYSAGVLKGKREITSR